MEYEPVIGLEIHAELKTRTKMFCDSLNDPDETHPNVNICPVCMAHPGTLPVINKEAVRKIIGVGLALNGSIPQFSQFDRKNYFYPDLPKGYQISQYEHPLVEGGYIEIDPSPAVIASPASAGRSDLGIASPLDKLGARNGEQLRKKIHIRRIHLEEDTGRLIHGANNDDDHDNDSVSSPSSHGYTLVDFNRAGIPLMELVTEPELRSAEETRLFAEQLRAILQYLDASDADMEKGEMRIEANVSLRPIGSSELGTRVELKNINSFRFVELAIAYEIERQKEVLDKGERVMQETRGWNERSGKTVSQRIKEESRDYRYFPEPDLPPLEIAPAFVEEIRASLPELPQAKLKRFREEYGIAPKLAQTLIRDKNLAHFFEAAVSELREWRKSRGQDPNARSPIELAANYLTTDLQRMLAEKGVPVRESLATPENFAELMTYLAEGRISSKAAKIVLAEMVAAGGDPSVILNELKLWQVSETGTLDETVGRVLAANETAAKDFKNGKASALQFLVGQVMKESRGANPAVVRKILEEKLNAEFQ